MSTGSNTGRQDERSFLFQDGADRNMFAGHELAPLVRATMGDLPPISAYLSRTCLARRTEIVFATNRWKVGPKRSAHSFFRSGS